MALRALIYLARLDCQHSRTEFFLLPGRLNGACLGKRLCRRTFGEVDGTAVETKPLILVCFGLFCFALFCFAFFCFEFDLTWSWFGFDFDFDFDLFFVCFCFCFCFDFLAFDLFLFRLFVGNQSRDHFLTTHGFRIQPVTGTCFKARLCFHGSTTSPWYFVEAVVTRFFRVTLLNGFKWPPFGWSKIHLEEAITPHHISSGHHITS